MALIEREALLAEINKWPESVMYKDWVQSAIAYSPTIDAAPVVHAQWEECDDDVNAWIRCPECGFEQDIDHFGDHRHEIADYKLCPSCGARMDGGAGRWLNGSASRRGFRAIRTLMKGRVTAVYWLMVQRVALTQ